LYEFVLVLHHPALKLAELPYVDLKLSEKLVLLPQRLGL